MLRYCVYHALNKKGPYVYWGKYGTLEAAVQHGHELQDFLADAYTPCYILILAYHSDYEDPKIFESVLLFAPKEESK